MSSYLVDTNVLLRGATSASTRHSTAAGAIAALLAQGDQLLIAPQVLVEFWSVATRPIDVNGFEWPVALVRGEIDRLLDQFPLLPEMPAVFTEWMHLAARHEAIGKRVHDTRLVAIMNVHQVSRLLTFNTSDFENYDVTVVSPEDIRASGATDE